MSNSKEKKIIVLAFITAFALTIYIAEMFIPKPLPFIKLGLSNVVIVYMIYSGLSIEALVVTLAKTIVGGFISGTIFSPTTLMSFSGGIFSYLVMLAFYHSKLSFSIIGISILGSISHNLGQLMTVKLFIIKDTKLLYLFPVMLVLGIATGLITGYFAHLMLKQIDIRSLYERTNL